VTPKLRSLASLGENGVVPWFISFERTIQKKCGQFSLRPPGECREGARGRLFLSDPHHLISDEELARHRLAYLFLDLWHQRTLVPGLQPSILPPPFPPELGQFWTIPPHTLYSPVFLTVCSLDEEAVQLVCIRHSHRCHPCLVYSS